MLLLNQDLSLRQSGGRRGHAGGNRKGQSALRICLPQVQPLMRRAKHYEPAISTNLAMVLMLRPVPALAAGILSLESAIPSP